MLATMEQPPTAPGRYYYSDAMPGARPQLLEVALDAGVLVALFPPSDDDEGASVPVADMAGTWSPA